MAADALTPVLGLVKPVVGDPAGEDLWGDKLNANADKIDAFAGDLEDAVHEAPEDGGIYARQNGAWIVAPTGETVSWNDVTDKPDEFPPEAHTHPIAQVTGLQTALDSKIGDAPNNANLYGRMGGAWAVVTIPSTAWNDITGKPSTFPPSAHTHPTSQVTGLDAALNTLDTDIGAVETAVATKIGDAPADGDRYVRRNSAWEELVLPPAVGLVDVADDPPVSPVDKQLWWESNSGGLYLRYNDGDSAQWVQVNQQTPFTFPPNDDGEYVMVNGVWRLKSQTLNFQGQSTLDVTVPAGASQVAWRGVVFQPTSAGQGMYLRASLDGATFLSGASDYQYVGWQKPSGGTTFSTYAQTGSAQIFLALTSDNTSVGHVMEGQLAMSKPLTSNSFFGSLRGRSYHSTASALYQDLNLQVWVVPPGSQLTIQKLRFFNSAGANFTQGKLHLDWSY